jgi:subtilisin family serine protease
MPTSHPTPSATTSKSLGCSHTFSAARMAATFARATSVGMRLPMSTQESIADGMLAVRFDGGRVSSQAAVILSRMGARQLSDANPQGAATFSVPAGSDVRAAAESLSGAPGVLSAGPIIYRHMLGLLPNDPQFTTGAVTEASNTTDQWDMFAIQMPSAWALTTGSAAVKIAVIDTGYDTGNNDLMGKVDASVVYDLGNGTVDTKNGVEDKDGHGSDVSGIAAADTNNGVDVAAVGWNVHLLEARVFPYGTNPGASTQDIAAAINWAVKNGAKVINLSLGSSTADNTYEEPAVAAAIKSGVIVVAAAGNDNANAIDFPAADPGVIAVGASAYCDSSKNALAGGYEYVASYSNYGAGLALVAPGGDPDNTQTRCTTSTKGCIDFLQWITNLDSLQGPFTEEVGLFAGTSQASPHVAGAVALMVSKDPALSPAQALSLVELSADKIGDPHQGAGRLNVLNALTMTP